jgi:energy-coupling factor transport system permease protein
MNNSRNTDLKTQELGKPAHLLQGLRLPHPAVLIFVWAGLAVSVQKLSGYPLYLLAGSLLLSSIMICSARFLLLVRRTRWILLSLFVIYAYTSQGTPLWAQFGVFSPAAEGMAAGFVQLLRLLAVLAGLSVLLSLLSQSQLMAGLYTLARPLVFTGMSRERFAARLALTLCYAESARLDTESGWLRRVEQMLLPKPELPQNIELSVATLTIYDNLIIVAALLAIAGVWL